MHASGVLLPSISVLSSSNIRMGNPLPSKPPVHDNFVNLAKRSCHFPDLAIDCVVLVVRADEGPIGRVDLAHVFLISGLPLMKSHIARILSYAVCWIVALTASAGGLKRIRQYKFAGRSRICLGQSRHLLRPACRLT